ncbi:MAG: hypothetical protein AVDCRST_MAG70-2134, partial [uncultured Thermomicrobiales bacterium]
EHTRTVRPGTSAFMSRGFPTINSADGRGSGVRPPSPGRGDRLRRSDGGAARDASTTGQPDM